MKKIKIKSKLTLKQKYAAIATALGDLDHVIAIEDYKGQYFLQMWIYTPSGGRVFVGRVGCWNRTLRVFHSFAVKAKRFFQGKRKNPVFIRNK